MKHIILGIKDYCKDCWHDFWYWFWDALWTWTNKRCVKCYVWDKNEGRYTKEGNPTFWVLENPATGDLVHYLGKPTMTFQPYEYGDGWAKKTALWGKFNKPAKQYTATNRPEAVPGLYWRPGRGYPSLAFQHKSAIEKIPQFAPFREFVKTDYDLRSITPPAFAQAFYEANNEDNKKDVK